MLGSARSWPARRPLEEVLVEHPVDATDGGKLLVLPAGPAAPQPGRPARLAKMRELVRQLEKQADLVIVDSVAALAVSDALPLLEEVSGSVWWCGWIERQELRSAGCRR